MQKQIILVLCIIYNTLLIAQQRDVDTLKPEVIQVIKAYTPSVKDAFKIKEIPEINTETVTKKTVEFTIKPFPVASTFVPAKGKAIDLEAPPKEHYYSNYAALGYGNYYTLLGELYLNYNIDRSQLLGASFTHLSSRGRIKNVALDNTYAKSKLQVNYSKTESDITYKIQVGGLVKKYNWYGLPEQFFTPETVENLEVTHNYYGANVDGSLQLEDSIFKTTKLQYQFFGDSYKSNEHHFISKSTVEVPWFDFTTTTILKAEYLGGKFASNYQATKSLKYDYINFGAAPKLNIENEKFNLNLGVKMYFLLAKTAKQNTFYIYPNIEASYSIQPNKLIAFAGINGDLYTNTYKFFATKNPYVSPTLTVYPTSNTYTAFAGFKGDIIKDLNFTIRGSYASEKDKALYSTNLFSGIQTNPSYKNGNSFTVVYDKVHTLQLQTELHYNSIKYIHLGFDFNYDNYTLENYKEAWNLPNSSATLLADYNYKKWNFGVELFYVGKRKDAQLDANLNLINTFNLSSYIDANVAVKYRISNKWNLFTTLNNITNQTNSRWNNYKVQGFQIVAGIRYSFNLNK